MSESTYFIASIIFAAFSFFALVEAAGRARNAERLTRRANTVELLELWSRASELDPQALHLIEPDFIQNAAVLEMTAIFWTFEIVDRLVMLEFAWPRYQRIYNQMKQFADRELISTNQPASSYLKGIIEDVYKQLESAKGVPAPALKTTPDLHT